MKSGWFVAGVVFVERGSGRRPQHPGCGSPDRQGHPPHGDPHQGPGPPFGCPMDTCMDCSHWLQLRQRETCISSEVRPRHGRRRAHGWTDTTGPGRTEQPCAGSQGQSMAQRSRWSGDVRAATTRTTICRGPCRSLRLHIRSAPGGGRRSLSWWTGTTGTGSMTATRTRGDH